MFFKKELAEDFDFRLKQAGQLASKMRLMSAPWLGLLKDDTWLKNARHANDMAEKLYQGIKDLPGVRIMFDRQVNVVFAEMSKEMQAGLRDKGWNFYTFIGEGGCRLMCAWDTLPETVDAFVGDIRELAGARDAAE